MELGTRLEMQRGDLPFARSLHEARSAVARDPARDLDHRVVLLSAPVQPPHRRGDCREREVHLRTVPRAWLAAPGGLRCFWSASGFEKPCASRACSWPTRWDLGGGGV